MIADPRRRLQMPQFQLSQSLRRLGALALFILIIGAIPWHLTSTRATVLLSGASIFLIAYVAFFVSSVRRLTSRLPFFDESQRKAEGFLLTLRSTGLPLIGCLFFLFWTIVYVAIWRIQPHEFTGLSQTPKLAEFFYYSVSCALISPPGDIVAHMQMARNVTMLEMLTGFAVLAAYLSSFAFLKPEALEAATGEDGEAKASVPAQTPATATAETTTTATETPAASAAPAAVSDEAPFVLLAKQRDGRGRVYQVRIVGRFADVASTLAYAAGRPELGEISVHPLEAAEEA